MPLSINAFIYKYEGIFGIFHLKKIHIFILKYCMYIQRYIHFEIFTKYLLKNPIMKQKRKFYLIRKIWTSNLLVIKLCVIKHKGRHVFRNNWIINNLNPLNFIIHNMVLRRKKTRGENKGRNHDFIEGKDNDNVLVFIFLLIIKKNSFGVN